MHPVRYFLFIALLVVLLPTVSHAAAFTIDASVREVYEDNIDPLLSGAARQIAPADGLSRLSAARVSPAGLAEGTSSATGIGDIYTVLNAALGRSAVVGVETEASLRAEITRDQFSKFTELNATRAGLRMAVYRQFSDMNAAWLGLTGARTVYGEPSLDAWSFGAAFEGRHQLTARFWIGEGLLLEQNNANADFFTFTGRAVSFRSGYAFGGGIAVGAGYSFLLRKFDSGSQTKLHAAAANATWQPVKHVQVFASFEHQNYVYGPTHVRTENNISSAGIGFSY